MQTPAKNKKGIKRAFQLALAKTVRGGKIANFVGEGGWVFSACYISDRFGWHPYYQLSTPEGKIHALGTGIDSCVNFAHDITVKYEQART